jgi:benzoate membrane transport protein
LRAPLLAGFVASITGTAASIGVVLAALTGLQATSNQTASAIFIMLVAYGALSILLSWRFKMPISIVWSTPGAAMLVAAGALKLGFATAVGGFLITGLLLILTGLWPALGRFVSRIPKPIASAMLAGVIFSFCVAPFHSVVSAPFVVLPVLAVWLVLYRIAPIWASPVAVTLAFVLIALTVEIKSFDLNLLPTLELVTPSFNLAGLFSIALPLYFVTMAGQNIPGIAIMKTFGFEVPFKATLVATGAATTAGSFFGGFALNLAAITAALNANEHAHKDPNKRWIASVSGGVLYLLLALVAAPVVSFVSAVPRELILAAAGVALFPTLVSAFTAATEAPKLRLAAIITFLVGASGVAFAGVGAAFWALLAGVVVWWVTATRDA